MHNLLGELGMICWVSGLSLGEWLKIKLGHDFVHDFVMEFPIGFIFLIF